MTDFAELGRRLNEAHRHHVRVARDPENFYIDGDTSRAFGALFAEAADAIATLTRERDEAYAADAQKTREWNIMNKEARGYHAALQEIDSNTPTQFAVDQIGCETGPLRATVKCQRALANIGDIARQALCLSRAAQPGDTDA